MAQRGGGRRLDVGTALGLVLCVSGILGGFILEGGTAQQMLGVSAALIVLGGCAGAVLIASPVQTVRGAMRRVGDVLFETKSDNAELVDRIVACSTAARKNGLVSLESEATACTDPFLKKALLLAADGTDLEELKSMMELEIAVGEERTEKEAKVFEAAGGFAPTIGIIGAVLGLIIVMGQIDDMQKVGHGIAAAFVATIYGVGSANLLFLPAAQKIKMRGAAERERQEMVLVGVCGIVEGMNPKLIRLKLEAFLDGRPKLAGRAGGAGSAAAQTAEGRI